MLVDNFRLLAAYNKWMNDKLIAAAKQLDQALLLEDRGAFFGSILGTLNHLMVADIAWLKRFAEHPSGFTALLPVKDMARPQALDEILHTDLNEFAEKRSEIDAIILAFTRQLSSANVEDNLCFNDMAGNAHEMQMALLLQHFFNHQTHHRGQVTTLFNQLGVDVGVTDLPWMIRQAPR